MLDFLFRKSYFIIKFLNVFRAEIIENKAMYIKKPRSVS
jgi:hypothetical protein